MRSPFKFVGHSGHYDVIHRPTGRKLGRVWGVARWNGTAWCHSGQEYRNTYQQGDQRTYYGTRMDAASSLFRSLLTADREVEFSSLGTVVRVRVMKASSDAAAFRLALDRLPGETGAAARFLRIRLLEDGELGEAEYRTEDA